MAVPDELAERVRREAEWQPDVSGGYHAFLSHADNSHWQSYRKRIFRNALAGAETVLEIGCTSWPLYIEEVGLCPKRVVCINIFEPHLDFGRDVARTTVNRPEFLLMDAHDLKFPDASFDVVFGSHILHHLETRRAVDQFHRVLRPGGRIVFDEPLGTNPVGNLVRWLTPGAHTADEEALNGKHFKIIREKFHLTLHFQQLLTVPAAALSKLLCSSAENKLMSLAYGADVTLLRLVPGIGTVYRHAILEARRR